MNRPQPPCVPGPLPPAAVELLRRIEAREAKAAVVGLGYVGLPLAATLADAGFRVVGVDVDGTKLAALSNGESYIADVDPSTVARLVATGQLTAATALTSDIDCVSICVPTPLRKTREPDLSFVVAAVEALVPFLRRGQLIVLESTTYPGTTDEIVVPAVSRSGLVVGQDVFVAFSPERVDPANPVYKTKNTPKVIGGATAVCGLVAERFYASAIEHVIRVSSATVAEMVKLLENTYRAINIGLANEMALICHTLRLDVWEVIDAAATKPFGFQPFYPGPGLGGHCIPIDPLYLSWKLKALKATARFIELADTINSSMPEHCVQRIADLLNDDTKPVRGSRVHLLGVAYKREVSDVRESPALDVAELLLARGADVHYSDPHVPTLRVGEHILPSEAATAEWLAAADVVAVLTDHRAFDPDFIAGHARRVFDARNLLKRHRSPHIHRL